MIWSRIAHNLAGGGLRSKHVEEHARLEDSDARVPASDEAFRNQDENQFHQPNQSHQVHQSHQSRNDVASLTDRELRRLRRVDLLEMLVEQGRELERVRAELANAREQLADRRIVIEGCGSIAEAALELSEVFEAAQRAADLYVENVRCVANASGEDASHGNDQLSVASERSATKTQSTRVRGACVQGARVQSECAQSARVQGERVQGERVAQPAQAEQPVQAAQLASPSSSARITHSERSHAASNPVDPAAFAQSAKASQGVYARNRAVAGRNNPRHAARSVR